MTYVAHYQSKEINKASDALLNYIEDKRGDYSDIVIVCIGTDRSTGDSLGPLVGEKLKRVKKPNFKVYGNLKEPVHAINLNSTMDHIKNTYSKPLIIAIDASLGSSNGVGKIIIRDEPLRPGAGVNKDLGEVGDISITGIVNVGGFMEYFVLQNTRLHVVEQMAGVIVKGVKKALKQIELQVEQQVRAI
jgi:putative sporulation protein YyaC